MVKSFVVLMALLLVGVWVVGCDEDTPTDPGNGGGTGNRAPAAPTIDTGAGAPADGSTDKSVTSILHWDCSDPDGDALTFDIYFGQSDPPSSAATGHTAESYNPGTLGYSTTYYWKIVAKDPDGETASSAVWSFTTMAQPTETVTTPTAPAGPAVGGTSESLSYTTGGSTSSAGHAVEYRFDWGDATYSDWSANTTVSNSWASAGTYSVKAQGRCASHNNVESAWSAAHDVVISAATETVSTPGAISGPTSGTTIDNMNYFVGSTSTSSLGHLVEYQFDWGDGTFSTWSNSAGSNHLWATAGTYQVKAQARCRDHTSVVSDWTAELTVDITAPSETVYIPRFTQYPEFWEVAVELSVSVQSQKTNVGHDIEIQIDYGDGTISSWLTTTESPPWVWVTGTHTYSAIGAYEVKARTRCADHTNIESDWSNAVTITIYTGAEIVSEPKIHHPATEEDRTVEIGHDITIYQSEAASSHGHDLEYRFDLGDGTVSPWDTYAGVTHSYSTWGDHQVKAQARCRDHTSIESLWSDEITIHVIETITRPDLSAPTTGTVGVPIHFSTTGSTSDVGHDLEYQFYVSRSYITPQGGQGWSSATELDYTHTQNAGVYYILVKARCATHTDVESRFSTHVRIVISNP